MPDRGWPHPLEILRLSIGIPWEPRPRQTQNGAPRTSSLACLSFSYSRLNNQSAAVFARLNIPNKDGLPLCSVLYLRGLHHNPYQHAREKSNISNFFISPLRRRSRASKPGSRAGQIRSNSRSNLFASNVLRLFISGALDDSGLNTVAAHLGNIASTSPVASKASTSAK